MTATDLSGLIRGSVLHPGDPDYDRAKTVWNCRFTSSPDVIVRPADADDVAAALRWARGRGVGITVKSGGHDYAGKSTADSGLLIDLSSMSKIEVDPGARTARLGPGARWGDVDRATQEYDLAAVGGTVSTVGVAGFVLGGGEGWLTRKHGLALDNLLGAEVVTADGEVHRVAPGSDLFWGLRGAGANLGVVTELELRLHDIGPDIMAGQVIYPFGEAPRLLRFYRDHFRDAPDELACAAFVLRIPPVEPFPEERHGELALDFVLAYLGDPDRGEAAIRPFRELGSPILDAVASQPYTDFQQAFDAALPGGLRWYTRAHYFDEISDAAIDAFLEGVQPLPGAYTTAYLFAGGGAAGRASVGSTAYPHRGATHGCHIFPGWDDPADDAAIMEWTREVSAELAPHTSGGVYVNMLAEDEADRIPDAYGPNHGRVVEMKREWDPDNVFGGNHNLAPRG